MYLYLPVFSFFKSVASLVILLNIQSCFSNTATAVYESHSKYSNHTNF